MQSAPKTDEGNAFEKLVAAAGREGPCRTPGCGAIVRGSPYAICGDCAQAADSKLRDSAISEFVRPLKQAIPMRVRFVADRGRSLNDFSARTDVAALHTALGFLLEGKSIVIVGESGAGKTTIAYALVVAFVRHAIRIYMTSDPYDTDRLRFVCTAHGLRASHVSQLRQMHPLGEGLPPEWTRAVSASLLVLDDVGVGRISSQAMSDLVHARCDELRPTIFTTHLDADRIAQSFGEDVARRMFETAQLTIARPVT